MITQYYFQKYKTVSRIGAIAIAITIINIPGFTTLNQAVAAEKSQELILTQSFEDLPGQIRDSISGDIIGVLLSDSRFTTLATVLKVTGLLDQLKEGGPFTIFAPTDEAFANLPSGMLEMLMKPENREQLTNLLKYHVIPGEVTSEELPSGEVQTVEGSSVNVDVESDGVMVEDANVIDADIPANNGVVHVIDKVMVLPE
ncbi:beta-Ig-H3/Fasciclin domain protein [Lyngbya aestuarii BL J]|uniref:Beta-Ig-H3/Fasciclin domain protein n=1 Tax=Lyngbya aestuarii BL J TaxID=1348334 RepID=U7Q9Y6_9CYAN|nr:fasciclin domain-containing protein [Lyngbya aestuarii]ERT04639.1 beta-Ig-H3/Fasciclin domain protein [Lyngbya aestuarii BL J]